MSRLLFLLMLSKLIEPAVAAERLNVSTKFIRRRIRDGTLKAYKIAGSRVVRVDSDDVDALLTPWKGGAA